MKRPLYALATLAASFALIAAACGGDDGGDGADGDTESTATATETTAATSEATSAPTTEATTPAEGTPEATSESGGETTSLSDVFDSYRHSFSMQMSVDGLGEMFAVTTEGIFITPDRRTATTNSGAMGFGTAIETVVIGDVVWVRQVGGEWSEFTRDTVPPEFAGDVVGSEDLQIDEETLAQIEELDGEPETLNSRETTRYELTEEFYQSMSSAFGETFNPSDFEEFNSTVWIDNETGQAIKMEMHIVTLPSAFGSDLEGLPVPPDARITMDLQFELSQINDDSLSIEEPAA